MARHRRWDLSAQLSRTDATKIHRAQRRGGVFNTQHGLSLVSTNVQETATEESEKPFSLFLESADDPEFVFTPPTSMQELFEGELTREGLCLTQNAKNFISQIITEHPRKAGRLTATQIITYALAYALLHSESWRGRAPIDGRQASSTVAVSQVSRRTSITVPISLSEAMRHLHNYMCFQHEVYPSKDSLKMTATEWGLSRIDEWRKSLSGSPGSA